MAGSSVDELSTCVVAQHGHGFVKKNFHKPTYCHHCGDMLWGLIQQGFVCEECNFVVHDRCSKTVVSPCSSISVSLVKNPVSHCWSDVLHLKRKFCNVCRKKLDDLDSMHCEICEYYVHVECLEYSVPDCKENATYVPEKQLNEVLHQHHWREGNLPNGSKCDFCKKSCSSTECLCGYRCEWCRITCHAACYLQVDYNCTFGTLSPIYLPPHAVSIPRTEVPLESIIGVQVRRKEALSLAAGDMTIRRSTVQLSDVLKRLTTVVLPMSCTSRSFFQPHLGGVDRSISEELCPSEVLRCREIEDNGLLTLKDKSSKKDEDRDEELVKIYDGNLGLRKRIFRILSVPKYTTSSNLVSMALRAFHINKDPELFYLSDINEETILRDPNPVLSLTRQDGRLPGVFIRIKSHDFNIGEVDVYPGKLVSTREHCSVTVNNNSTVYDMIRDSLDKLELPYRYEDIRCLELMMDRAVNEKVLEDYDRPWEIIRNLGRESLCQLEQMRFYLQLRHDPHGPNVALFIGNLPANLVENTYKNLLTDILGTENKIAKIGPIYYEYGSMVISFEDSRTAVRSLYVLRETKFEDKQPLLVMLLPNIEPSMIPPDVNPLLIFVNVKSGGRQGMELISSFRKLLNPYQVFDLDIGGPLPGLYVFRNIAKYKILVCGGDGTIGWVLQCLDNVGQDSQCSSPACAIVPLGTGNDLARVLRWGAGYADGEDPLNLLKDVIEAEEILLDRWTVVLHPEDKTDKFEAEATKQVNSTGKKRQKLFKMKVTNEQIKKSVVAGSTSEDNSQILVMNNYFGIGIDADLCLDFHNAREENPGKFISRLHNKSVYVKMGLRRMVGQGKAYKELQKVVQLEVDFKPVHLPAVEGIIVLNILSWGSGSNPWGPEKDQHFSKPTHYDGLLEVVGVTGVVHLGQIQSGLRSAMRIAQGKHIRIHLKTDVPVQVDGEPWIQSPCEVVILKSALKATMLKKKKFKRRPTEPILDAAAGGTITPMSSTSITTTITATTATPTSITAVSEESASTAASSNGDDKSKPGLDDLTPTTTS